MSIIEKIKERISQMNEGEIMMTADFADIASITTVRKCLSRCLEEGMIRRVFGGVYEKPRFSKLLNEFMPADPEKVAYALARTYHWTIAPCGDIAVNKLGLTTQVPAVWSYVSDGPYRKFKWDNIQIKFKHRTNRELSQMSGQTSLVVEALRALGKDHINENVIEHLRRKLPQKEKDLILGESSSCCEWICETIRKICVS